MDNAGLIVGTTNVAVGILIYALCVPLAKGKVKRNNWYGIRIPKSMESDENWYRINKYAAYAMYPWAVATILVGLVTLFLDIDANRPVAIIVSVFPVSVVIPVIRTYLWSRDLP
jgi:uncharacterized membrane protein